ncbi:MAG: CoA transferase [Chloroflexota bacterium]|nr:CoA transferase [Chloroflexota bacterium]
MPENIHTPDRASLGHLRILEYGGIPSSYATRWLGDLGADIIKIEPLKGDPNRLLPPFANNIEDPERSLSFINANLNKRSIALDIVGSPKDKETFLQLIETADALIESNNPGYLEELGLGQEILLGRNKRLVTTSITPFGETGPYAAYKGSHAIVEALSGFMSVHGDDLMPPVVTPNHITYQLAGVHSSYLTLAGIRHARRSGQGQKIDQALTESISYMAMSAIARYSGRNEVLKRHGIKGQAGASNIFRCKDGKYIYMSIFILPHWHKITREWMEDPLLSGVEWDNPDYREENADVISMAMQDFVAQFTSEDFVNECQKRGLPCAPVNTPGDFMQSNHLKQRKWVQKIDHPIIGEYEAPGFPFKMEKTPMKVWRSSPTLGQHQDEILDELSTGSRKKTNAAPKEKLETKDSPMLKGIRVADLSRFFAGPIGTMFMGFYGAEVIKLESELLVATREGVLYPDMNRNKLSATFDLRNSDGKLLLEALLKQSDIFIDNFSPRVIDRLGFGRDKTRTINPGLIQITAPGMGLDGPLTDWVTWGTQLLAYTGMIHMWGHEESPMESHGKIVIPDYLGAALVALSSLAAIEFRDLTGEGQFIELAQLEAQGALMGPSILDSTVNTKEWDAQGYNEILGQQYSPYGAYPCLGEDEWVIIAVETEEEWQGLKTALGEPKWVSDKKFNSISNRRANRKELDSNIANWSSSHYPHPLMHLLQSLGVPAGVMLKGEHLLNNQQMRSRAHVVDNDQAPWGKLSHQGLPGIPSISASWANGRTPLIGDDNDYVFRKILGLSKKEIEDFTKLGAIK